MAVVTMADPNPVVTLTLMPPIMLQTMMYHNMLFLPYLPGGGGLCGYSDMNGSGDTPRGKEEYDDQGGCNEDGPIHQEARRQE